MLDDALARVPLAGTLVFGQQCVLFDLPNVAPLAADDDAAAAAANHTRRALVQSKRCVRCIRNIRALLRKPRLLLLDEATSALVRLTPFSLAFLSRVVARANFFRALPYTSIYIYICMSASCNATRPSENLNLKIRAECAFSSLEFTF